MRKKEMRFILQYCPTNINGSYNTAQNCPQVYCVPTNSKKNRGAIRVLNLFLLLQQIVTKSEQVNDH